MFVSIGMVLGGFSKSGVFEYGVVVVVWIMWNC